MSPLRRGPLAIALLAAALAAPAAAAASLPSTTLYDKAYGYTITLPKAWRLIPRSVAGVRALIAQLETAGSAEDKDLADTYATILASSTGKTGLGAYRLQVFAWPPDSQTPLLTEVSLGIVTTSNVYGAGELATAGREYADAFGAAAGARVLEDRQLRLPAGRAQLVEAKVPAGGGLSNGVELYLIPHGRRLFELFMTIDARFLSEAQIFTSIADHFAFRS